jgi:nucleotide-binding universal stress UspA family protein
MFRHLLVPLDGSKLAEIVLPATADLARMAEARVTLLHVLEEHAHSEVHGDRHLTELGEAEDYLKAAAGSECFRGIRTAWHVHDERIRDLPDSLVSHASEMAPDLIVLCEHGSHRTRDMLSGNLAQRVVRHGKTPVFLLRAEGAAAMPRRILAPLDGSPDHERGLEPAEALAKITGAEIELLTVVPTVEHLSGEYAVTGNLLPASTRARLDFAEQDAVSYLADHVTRLRDAGLAASATVARGDRADQICDFVATRAIDCVALGTHGKAGAGAFWAGSLAQRLIHRTWAAFLLTPV